MNIVKEIDEFGARMKSYELLETGRTLNQHVPIYARIDGRSFSKFTRDMERPYDIRITNAMIETTKYLVHKTSARIGYTQSDEISLVWLADDVESDIFFAGKIQKMCSVLAALTTAKFMFEIPEQYRMRLPHFDARVFQLPSKIEAANTILWRAMDARKNAISMVAQTYFSHKKLYRKNQTDMLAMLAELTIDFDRYPTSFRRGSFIQRRLIERTLTDYELSMIPHIEKPTSVIRSTFPVLDMPPFNMVSNRVEVIFDSEEPKLKEPVSEKATEE